MSPLSFGDFFVNIARCIGLERLAAAHTRRSFSRRRLEKEELQRRLDAMRPKSENSSSCSKEKIFTNHA
ncbi:MAG: hypothetical protein K1X79_01470 [Oligoflexia bacterium]|nr:hypothetical protein [Oligoflexia bacterium]